MWSGKTPGRATPCRVDSFPVMRISAATVILALLLAPRSALAEEGTDMLSEVFGLEETAQAGTTDNSPDQTAVQTATKNRDAQADQGAADTAATATDTGAKTGAKTGSTSVATDTSAQTSKPVTGSKNTPDGETPGAEQPDAPNTPSDSAFSQSTVLSTAAGVNGQDVEGEGTTGGTMAIPQASSPAGQSRMNGAAAARITAPAQTGNSGQADNTRAAAEVWDARTGIVTPGRAGRVVHVFGASIPTLVCQPGMVCLMELEAGEEVLDTPVQADPARWRVELRHRDAPVSQTYFAFKPSEDAAARSNFVVLTDRRVYVVNLVKDLLRSTYILSFDYPDTRARTMTAEIAARSAAKRAARAAAHTRRTSAIARSGVSTTRGKVPARELDFNYSIRGTAAFKPLRVYNDGRKTYVDLPGRYRGDLPVVIGGAGADNKAFNYRVGQNGTRFIIDRVLRDFVLQDGRKRIRIRRGS